MNAESTEKRGNEAKKRKEKRRGTVVPDRESPPFPPKAGEGWGTLKYVVEWRNAVKPKRTDRSVCATEGVNYGERVAGACGMARVVRR